jgi:hypothetical protein
MKIFWNSSLELVFCGRRGNFYQLAQGQHACVIMLWALLPAESISCPKGIGSVYLVSPYFGVNTIQVVQKHVGTGTGLQSCWGDSVGIC